MALTLLAGCSTTPPRDQGNICSIYRQYPDWYEDTLKMEQAWGLPPHVAMAIIKQESSFVEDALPPRDYFLWVIPWGRVSSAYGYAQAVMFVGWYAAGTQRQLGISKWDTYSQYLAYHEGRGGFSRQSYLQKPWLMQVARKVEQQAKNYGWQLKQCRSELENNRGWW